jgi:hypothetical protein
VQELIQAVGQAQEKGYKSILTFGGCCGEEPFFFTLFSKDIKRRSSSVPKHFRASSRHFDDTLSCFLHSIPRLCFYYVVNKI